MNKPELLPCPFCGGEAQEEWGGTAEFYGHDHQSVAIECMRCHVSLAIYTSCGKDGKPSKGYEFACSCHNDTGAIARSRWNERCSVRDAGRNELLGLLRDMRNYLSEALSYEREKFKGYEFRSDIRGIEADIARIDAALAKQGET